MTETKHTPEPWEAKSTESFDATSPALVVTGADGNICYMSRHFTKPHPKSGVDEARARADMAHIVACVNGCKDLNPAAYQECVDALKAALPLILDTHDVGVQVAAALEAAKVTP